MEKKLVKSGVTLNSETGEYEPNLVEESKVKAMRSSKKPVTSKKAPAKKPVAKKAPAKKPVAKKAPAKTLAKVKVTKTAKKQTLNEVFTGARHGEVIAVLKQLPERYKKSDFLKKAEEVLGYSIPFNKKVREVYSQKDSGKYSAIITK